VLPDGNAFDFIQMAETEGIGTPVIVITGHGDEMVASRLIQAGAYDYLSKKQINTESLCRAISSTLEKAGLRKEINKAHQKMAEMSTIDELTGLYNRRFFSDSLNHEVTRAGRYKTDLALCIIDIDHFKRVNDTWGHSAGDLVLKEIARILQEAARKTDIPCRYGGEEFAVILTHTESEGARIFSERFRKQIAAHGFKINDTTFFVTVSCGIFSFNHDPDLSSIQLFEHADKALYQAKETGRNRVVVGE
jgi:two-component system cell cycle response regulator